MSYLERLRIDPAGRGGKPTIRGRVGDASANLDRSHLAWMALAMEPDEV